MKIPTKTKWFDANPQIALDDLADWSNDPAAPDRQIVSLYQEFHDVYKDSRVEHRLFISVIYVEIPKGMGSLLAPANGIPIPGAR